MWCASISQICRFKVFRVVELFHGSFVFSFVIQKNLWQVRDESRIGGVKLQEGESEERHLGLRGILGHLEGSVEA